MSTSSMVVFQILAAYLFKRGVNVKILVLVGTYITASCWLICSFVKTWAAFTLIYGALTGIGYGTCYFLPIMCAIEWWPE
jgi:hypothetical protein